MMDPTHQGKDVREKKINLPLNHLIEPSMGWFFKWTTLVL